MLADDFRPAFKLSEMARNFSNQPATTGNRLAIDGTPLPDEHHSSHGRIAQAGTSRLAKFAVRSADFDWLIWPQHLNDISRRYRYIY